MYLLNMDTRNTSCMLEREGGRASLYAIRPIHSRISKGLIK